MHRLFPLLLFAGLCDQFAYAQTVYNTVVVTNQGQFVNARLDDNVYMDMTTNPPRVRARRPQLHLRPVEQTDGSWLLPATAVLTPSTQMVVVLNGLEATENVDYKVDPSNPRRLIPYCDQDPAAVNVRWHRVAAGQDYGPFLVKVHLYP